MIQRAFFFLSMAISVFASQSMQTRVQDVSPQQLQKQNKEIVVLAAKELSKNLPQKIDRYTTCTKIEAKGTSLEYTFELNVPKKSDEEIKKEDKSRMEKMVTRGVCLSSKRLMDAEITVVYKYISHKTKNTLFVFPISKEKCKTIYEEYR